jgi:dipeptidyl aminopeptidase/acylaminoacyl peptidase
MRKIRNWCCAAALALLGTGGTVIAADAEKLIPRSVLFGNPQRSTVRLSPDGKFISYLAPVDGVMNLWLAPVGDFANAKPVSKESTRGIRSYEWTHKPGVLVYEQDSGGDENFHLFAVNASTMEVRDLTPIEGVQARIYAIDESDPETIYVGLNDRVPQLHDIQRIYLDSGRREMVEENPGFIGYVLDHERKARLALTFSPKGSMQVMQATDKTERWQPFMEIPSQDMMTTSPAGFSKDGKQMYLIDSRDRNTAALFAYDLETGKQTLVAEDPRADVSETIAHPSKKHVQAVAVEYDRRKWIIVDEDIKADLEVLDKHDKGEWQITSRSFDDASWIVAYQLSDGPIKYYLYDRASKSFKFLFNNRVDLNEYQLSPMEPVIIKARDGLELVCYMTLPKSVKRGADGKLTKAVPMVLNVHGGPWARDNWGFDPTHQWLADRGYAVISVNYRGSTGFGKDFINKANNEWAGKMHDDLIDVVNWAVKEGIARKDKVAIMGGSYGGYATLVGLTFTPDVFACGVDIVGPSSLVTLIENVPPYWMPMLPMLTQRVGDVRTEEGRKKLLERSPLTKVQEIRKPLLIGQGANDPRVKQQEADQIVEAMKSKKIPVTYILYPDEGHGFVRPENRMSFFAVTEAFLAKHLGGAYQPVGDEFAGASIQVPEGADQVPGLAEALQSTSQK